MMTKISKRISLLLLSCLLLCLAASCGILDSAGETEMPDGTVSGEPSETTEPEESETAEPEGTEGPEETGEPEETAEQDETEEPDVVIEPNENVARPSTNGALSVKGTHLTDSSGEPVQLRGVSTHGLAWYPEYVNQRGISEISSWGADLLRLAVYTAEDGGYCTDGDQEKLKDLVRQGVEYATSADMYAIVDWHVLSEGSPAVYQEEAEDFFDVMSEEFAGYDNVLYEICNEPTEAGWGEIKEYAEDIIPIIRANDPDAVIIVGTPDCTQDVDAAAADPIRNYDNIMYALHFYAATHKEELQNKLIAAEDAGIPVFVTEFGICDASGDGAIDVVSANTWVDLLDEYGISYAMWNLSNKDESSSMIDPGVTKTSGLEYDDLSASGKWLYDTLQAAMNGSSLEADAEADAVEQAEARKAADTITQDGISFYPELDSSWEEDGETFCLYRATVTNIGGSAVSTWSVTLDFNEKIRVTDFWNCACTADGTTLTVSASDYNGNLTSGETVEDIGFILAGTDELALEH